MKGSDVVDERTVRKGWRKGFGSLCLRVGLDVGQHSFSPYSD